MCTSPTPPTMNNNTNPNNNNNTNSSLTARREALLHRRNNRRMMASFRMPKESTKSLLHFHMNANADQRVVANDPPPSAATTKVVPTVPSLNRRRRAMQRSNKRMHSFRLPKEQTHLLLSDHFVEDLEASINLETATEAIASVQIDATTTTTSIATAKPASPTLLRNSSSNNQKSRRCRALQLHTKQKATQKMSSFRLPKEQTKQLMHTDWEAITDDLSSPQKLVHHPSSASASARTA